MPFVCVLTHAISLSIKKELLMKNVCVCKCSTVYKIPKGRCTNWPPSLIDGTFLRHSIQKGGMFLQQFLKENECFLALPTGSHIYIYIYIYQQKWIARGS
jgi:hypothetical protein